MKKYLEELRKIETEVYTNMGISSQITIDVIHDALEILDRDFDENPIELDELGQIEYEVDLILEICKEDLRFDIKILKRIEKIIKDWHDDIIFVNNSLLGILPSKD